jgi:hypothetical protein
MWLWMHWHLHWRIIEWWRSQVQEHWKHKGKNKDQWIFA